MVTRRDEDLGAIFTKIALDLRTHNEGFVEDYDNNQDIDLGIGTS